MTQVTPRGTWVPSVPSRSSAQAACCVRGVVAAGLGLGSFAVLVTVLWISSPHPDSGPGGALRVAAGLWLLAHGVELVRYDTLSGLPAPVGLTPMLLVALPLWLTHRAARDAVDGGGGEEGESGPRVSGGVALCGVVGGYAAVGAAAFLYAYGGPLPAAPLSAVLHLPLVAALGAGAGVWTGGGLPLAGWPQGVREVVVRPRFRVALRAAGAGVVGLVGGGGVVALAGLVWHAGAAQAVFLQLAGDWSGRLALALLVVALAPNAAVWGAAYGLGPGFALGTGATVAPLGVWGTPALPHFPLLAALPGGTGPIPVQWATLAVPVGAAGALAWFTVRAAAPPFAVREEAWSARDTAAAAALAGVGCGAGAAVLAALAGGPLGVRALSEFGPVWWLTGGAAAVWTVALGVPAALILRAWRLRDRTPRSWRRAAKTEEAGVAPVVSAVRPAEVAGGEDTGAAKRRWWRRGSTGTETERTASADDDGTSGAGRRWWRPRRADGADGADGVTSGSAPRRVDGGGSGTAGSAPWWRARRAMGGQSGTSGSAPWWRPGGTGGDTGPYDSEADFLPIGDPDATVGADWHESGSRELRWAALKEASGGLMAAFPAPSTTPEEPNPAKQHPSGPPPRTGPGVPAEPPPANGPVVRAEPPPAPPTGPEEPGTPKA
ncbi:cell division protein PerM [Streptomyces sp. NPDC054887]